MYLQACERYIKAEPILQHADKLKEILNTDRNDQLRQMM